MFVASLAKKKKKLMLSPTYLFFFLGEVQFFLIFICILFLIFFWENQRIKNKAHNYLQNKLVLRNLHKRLPLFFHVIVSMVVSFVK